MLPTTKTPKREGLEKQVVLLHGAPKTGKSSWCSHTPNALFLATEPGLGSLDVYQVPITNWPEFLVACGDVAKGDHEFKTVIVDTVDLAYQYCARHICESAGVVHESDLSYGKGSALINREFHRVLAKLGSLPYGLFLVSHSTDREIETKLGKRVKTVPTLPNKAREVVLAMVDIVLYVDVEPQRADDGKIIYKRVMRTKPSAEYEAGDRTGRLPETIPLDYEAFKKAFEDGAVPAAAELPAAAPKAEKKITMKGAVA